MFFCTGETLGLGLSFFLPKIILWMDLVEGVPGFGSKDSMLNR